MNFQGRRRIAILMLFAILFLNLFPISGGDGKVIVTPMVMTAQAADVTIAPGQFGMESDADKYPSGSLIEMSGSSMSIGIAHSSGSIPTDANVSWLPYNEDVIKVENAGNYKVKVSAVGPGYSQFAAIVTYNHMDYQVYCQIHVPLAVDTDTSANLSTTDHYGMIGSVNYGDGGRNVSFQLSTQPVTGTGFDRNHYLIKLKNVKYKPGIDNNTTATGSAIAVSPPAVTWTSKDDSIAKVNESGIITAVGAGYTEIVAETTTTYNNKTESIKIPVFVAPVGQVSGVADPMTDNLSFTASSNTFTINTNASVGTNLVWTVHKGTNASGEKIDPAKSNLMDMDVSKYSGSATFTKVKAGKYYITARTTDKLVEGSGSSDRKVKELKILVDVPVHFEHDKITMTVGDFYDIMENSNLPDKTWYRFIDTHANIAEVNASGLITAKGSGNTLIKMEKTSIGAGFGATDQQIDVTVVDKMQLNTSDASIFVGSTLQLKPNASNNAAPLTWTSSDPKIAMVDEDGLVTGLKAGDCVITVKQVINGVTKSLSCNIRVIASVTKIVLDPIEKDIAIGDNLTINATATPKINNLKLVWVTSDESIVKISSPGDLSATVTGVAGGTAVISAINKDNIIVGSCLVRVYQPIEKITLSETDVKVPLSDKTFRSYLRQQKDRKLSGSQRILRLQL